ncbi:hypothetical protein ACFYVL_00545 [Streptomyces sp. NPDC004111]|uniref:hypothetical protein n=1 Tax=Streptomyces sp. NPDC004111 TaxID=3364690 RepID=UPI003674CE68
MVTDRLDAGRATADAAMGRRELAADAPGARPGVWQRRLDGQVWRAERETAGYQQRSYAALMRARGLVEASQVWLERGEIALRCARARRAWEQRIVESEMANSEAQQDSNGTARRQVLENRVRRLREDLEAAASALGAAQRELAGEYERLAAEQPARSAEYQRRALQARRAAIGLDAGPAGAGTAPDGQ